MLVLGMCVGLSVGMNHCLGVNGWLGEKTGNGQGCCQIVDAHAGVGVVAVREGVTAVDLLIVRGVCFVCHAVAVHELLLLLLLRVPRRQHGLRLHGDTAHVSDGCRRVCLPSHNCCHGIGDLR